jgi:hypothetical protein
MCTSVFLGVLERLEKVLAPMARARGDVNKLALQEAMVSWAIECLVSVNPQHILWFCASLCLARRDVSKLALQEAATGLKCIIVWLLDAAVNACLLQQ